MHGPFGRDGSYLETRVHLRLGIWSQKLALKLDNFFRHPTSKFHWTQMDKNITSVKFGGNVLASAKIEFTTNISKYPCAFCKILFAGAKNNRNVLHFERRPDMKNLFFLGDRKRWLMSDSGFDQWINDGWISWGLEGNYVINFSF